MFVVLLSPDTFCSLFDVQCCNINNRADIHILTTGHRFVFLKHEAMPILGNMNNARLKVVLYLI